MSNIKNNKIQVLFEDNHIIAVNKNPSDIVLKDKTRDTPLSELVKIYLKHIYKKEGKVPEPHLAKGFKVLAFLSLLRIPSIINEIFQLVYNLVLNNV